VAERVFNEVYEADIAEIASAAGVGAGDVFMYSSHPTPTQGRWVFQSWVGSVPDAEEVCLSWHKAAENVSVLLAWCRAHPDEAKRLTQNYRQ
jgi:hypothetical protein